MSTINLLENTAQSWYDAGYINVRRRYSRGLSFLANYTFAKSLDNAPDFRSPMFEPAIPQNDNDLKAEKGPACDVRHRVAVSTVYNPPSWNGNAFTRMATRNWQGSMELQLQTGFPMTISVFGDTANAGTAVVKIPFAPMSQVRRFFRRVCAMRALGSIPKHLRLLRPIPSEMFPGILSMGQG